MEVLRLQAALCLQATSALLTMWQYWGISEALVRHHHVLLVQHKQVPCASASRA